MKAALGFSWAGMERQGRNSTTKIIISYQGKINIHTHPNPSCNPFVALLWPTMSLEDLLNLLCLHRETKQIENPQIRFFTLMFWKLTKLFSLYLPKTANKNVLIINMFSYHEDQKMPFLWDFYKQNCDSCQFPLNSGSGNCYRSIFKYIQYFILALMLFKGVKEHKCGICGREFTLLANMKRHVLIHTNIRAYQCHLCFKSFVQKQTLKAHMIVHSDVKPFKCKVSTSCDGTQKKQNGTCVLLIHYERTEMSL